MIVHGWVIKDPMLEGSENHCRTGNAVSVRKKGTLTTPTIMNTARLMYINRIRYDPFRNESFISSIIVIVSSKIWLWFYSSILLG